MPTMRYGQFCALARAAEIIGERWSLLIIRELMLGPKRFTDLRGGLPDISSSVLTDRLAGLEDAGLIAQRVLPPPAASTVYELTADGRALEPAVFELVRWGARYLMPRRRGERFDPGWLQLALSAYALRSRSPSRTFELRVKDGGREARIVVRGGRAGTRIEAGDGDGAVDARISADVEVVLGMMAGRLDARQALAAQLIGVEGDAGALDDFRLMFVPYDGGGGEAAERERRRPRARERTKKRATRSREER